METPVVAEKIMIVAHDKIRGLTAVALAKVIGIETDDSHRPVALHYQRHEVGGNSWVPLHGTRQLADEGRTWVRGWHQADIPVLRAAFNLFE